MRMDGKRDEFDWVKGGWEVEVRSQKYEVRSMKAEELS